MYHANGVPPKPAAPIRTSYSL